jgi:hypothetical protein
MQLAPRQCHSTGMSTSVSTRSGFSLSSCQQSCPSAAADHSVVWLQDVLLLENLRMIVGKQNA